MVTEEEPTNMNNNGKRKGTKRNLAMVCLSFASALTALNAASNLQSSINTDQNVGLNSLAIESAAAIVACLFFTTPFVYIFGYKWSIISGQIGVIIYIAGNMYPKQWLMFSVAIVSGIFRACMSIAQDAYITMLGIDENSHGDADTKVEKYFCIFLASYQSAQIWGNLISYFVLRNNPQYSKSNLTQCGANFLESEHKLQDEDNQVSPKTIYILYSIFIGIIFVSMMFIMTFLSQRREMKKDTSKSLLRKSLVYTVSVGKEIIKPNHLILLPLAFRTVAPEAFIMGVFTNSFITCTIGIQYVGLIMTIYGITATVCSIIITFMVQWKYSRPICFLLASILSYTGLIIMLLWQPTLSQTYLLFILPCLTSVSDAITEPFITAFYGSIFPGKKEVAFSILVLMQDAGFAIVYLYSSLIRVRTSIILQIAYLTLAMLSYIITEIRQLRVPMGNDVMPSVLNNLVSIPKNEHSSD